MPWYKAILLIISSITVLHAAPPSELSLKKSDSIYQEMTAIQRVQQLMIVPAKETKTSLETFQSAFGNKNHILIAELDEKLNPNPKEFGNLPDLYTLATLSDQHLLFEYFKYLESFLKNAGYIQCILPTVRDSLSRSGLLMKSLKAFNPDYFLHQTDLGHVEKLRKKSLESAIANHDFIIVNQNELGIIHKKLERFSNKIEIPPSTEERIKWLIAAEIESGDERKHELPMRLAVAISKGSVIPLVSKEKLFPISSDTICLLTDEPYGALANMMRKYAYVKTTYEEIGNSHAPVILDGSAHLPSEEILEDKKVIYIGKMEKIYDYNGLVDAALVYYQKNGIYDYVIPQQLFGAVDVNGKLPINDLQLSSFSDESVEGYQTLGYAPGEMMGLDETARKKIQEILNEAVSSGSTPGGQLAVAVDGAIVLDQAFGYLTYDSLIPSERSTLYDIASVTKVTGTLLAVMKLYEDGIIDLDQPIGNYLSEFQGSNKEQITIRALLSHNAGLRSYVPFWQQIINSEYMDVFYYQTGEDEQNDRRSYGLRPDPKMLDTLNHWIIDSKLITTDSLPSYRYSDIGFMILHQLVSELSKQPMDEFLFTNFYEPLGLKRICFNPMDHGFERFEIAPTEYDYYFRDELVWGEVHDRNAAVFGGVAGHAGLFSNARELLTIMQALIQGGSYGGSQLLLPSTINYFNQQFYPDNRRALGWDKLDMSLKNFSTFSSPTGFGHTGFTGTMVWADPMYNLTFVFLSNRIYPNANNYKLNKLDIRTRLQDVVYEALITKWIK